MPRRGDFPGRGIEENRMAAAFAEKPAAMGLQMAKEVDPLR
jgi:hypothetical protein